MLKKGLSQHLIKDKNITDKIVRLASIGPDDTVIEIGAGQGDLTKSLAEKARCVYAIELDRAMEPYLGSLEQEKGNVRLIFGDFLTMSLGQFKTGRPVKVVANIPYKITGPILFKLLEERQGIESVHLTVQKEIALRLAAKPFTKSYGAMSVIFQIFARVEILFAMKPAIFVPPPRVDSAFVAILWKKDRIESESELKNFIKACFQNKRKYLKNALSRNYTTAEIARLYREMDFPPSVRAEELEHECFERMYRTLASGGTAP
jgi:16S rRNA (adenine1518-N6/adenine1519-N6)-dimethyltransferase